MKGKYIIPVLCLTLLCGCANQNTTVAEVTPTPDVTEVPVATPTPKPTVDPEEWIWDYYVTDYQAISYHSIRLHIFPASAILTSEMAHVSNTLYIYQFFLLITNKICKRFL